MLAVLTENGTLEKNSLEKLQDGGDHLRYGVHGGILITVGHKTDKIKSSLVRETKVPFRDTRWGYSAVNGGIIPLIPQEERFVVKRQSMQGDEDLLFKPLTDGINDDTGL